LLQIYPGIWKFTFGEPEAVTPAKLRHRAPAEDALRKLSAPKECPIPLKSIVGQWTTRGCKVAISLDEDEQIYGLGLQLSSFNQRGKKKTLRVNSDPKADLGDSHAPVPFYVSTKGYGVLVDTTRYATFYIGSTRKVGQHIAQVVVEVPHTAGVDVYIFAGPGIVKAIQRYNLFSGGGCLPARWGLGVWYRCHLQFNQKDVLRLADDFRRDRVPCDVIGLEPGWQTHSYSCSFVWSDKFPQPNELISKLLERNYHLNLWTHAFIHESSPVYAALKPFAGDYEVWEGLVPDLTMEEARRILAECYEKLHVNLGVSGYKLDECDNSDYVTAWSYPELSQFPSGLDGEQMHSLMGIQYQETVYSIFRKLNRRTYGGVRSSYALAAPYPFVLYSDLYDHKDFIRGVVNSGFSGLLWTPEVRSATSAEDLIRRLQTVVFSPQTLINAWSIRHPPWKQWDAKQNNADLFVENWGEVESACRSLLELRMRLIPYLYSAFYRYYQEGIPPFRALVIDYPSDQNVWKIDDQYMVGDRVMVAPVTANTLQREVYLPEGRWYDFWTGQKYRGGAKIDYHASIDIIPFFIKSGSLLPLATPTLHTEDPLSYQLSVNVYGDGSLPITLYEDDGKTFDYLYNQFNRLDLLWDNVRNTGIETRTGDVKCPRYTVKVWERIP